MRGQLGERLPNAYGIAAKAMGMTTAELNKALELGEVMSDEFLPKFAKALRETFTQADLERGMNSLNSNIIRLGNSFFRMGKIIGEGGSNEGFNGVIKEMLILMDNLAPAFSKVGSAIYFLVGPMRAVMRLVEPFKNSLKDLRDLAEDAGMDTDILAGTLGVMAAVMMSKLKPKLWGAAWRTGVLAAVALVVEDLEGYFSGDRNSFLEAIFPRDALFKYFHENSWEQIFSKWGDELERLFDKLVKFNLEFYDGPFGDKVKDFLKKPQWVTSMQRWIQDIRNSFTELKNDMRDFSPMGLLSNLVLGRNVMNDTIPVTYDDHRYSGQGPLQPIDKVEINISNGNDSDMIQTAVKKGLLEATMAGERLVYRPLEG